MTAPVLDFQLARGFLGWWFDLLKGPIEFRLFNTESVMVARSFHDSREEAAEWLNTHAKPDLNCYFGVSPRSSTAKRDNKGDKDHVVGGRHF